MRENAVKSIFHGREAPEKFFILGKKKREAAASLKKLRLHLTMQKVANEPRIQS